MPAKRVSRIGPRNQTTTEGRPCATDSQSELWVLPRASSRAWMRARTASIPGVCASPSIPKAGLETSGGGGGVAA
eukprot:7074405-Pyramimonas_sp.AAC.1